MRYVCPHCGGKLEVVAAYVVVDYLTVDDEVGRFEQRDVSIVDLGWSGLPQGLSVQCSRCFAKLDDHFEARPDGQVHPRKEA